MTGHDTMARIALALTLAVTGCGPADTAPVAGVTGSALVEANGLSPNGLAMNGLAMNGLAMNGLAMNGLAMNGLAMNGLSTPEFGAWFDADPATAASVMTYVVRCAAAAEQSYAFTSPTTGIAYSWTGSLGLAPGWASGLPANVAEQQVVTACLAAHVNKYGIHMPLSVRGLGATGVAIPYADGELATYSVPEAAFFGNLFAGEGVFACMDHKPWNRWRSSARACGFDSKTSGVSDCAPIVIAGYCPNMCTDNKDRSRIGYYKGCTFNGVTYHPITTQLSPDEIYLCGDGVCQVSEHCGTGNTYDSCLADCGDCSTALTGPQTTTKTTTTTTATTTTTTKR